MLHSTGTLIGRYCAIRQDEPALLAATDQGFDRVAEKPACNSPVAEFAGPLQVFPSDQKGVFK